ncbi:hypothetical protein V6N11_084136 [Hibiscus sabdariffa]|uniref:RNase H type-1 domain-containing protein n=1 Tax=Hibiscus sabdariffa TaxID=183260 RepID=A0ABR2QDJ8_9ROSI
MLVEDVGNWGPRPFKLFNYLMDEEGFEETVVSSIRNLKLSKRIMELQGEGVDRKKIHWVDWRALCAPLASGVASFFSLWHDSCLSYSKESIWPLIPFVILWSIRLLRNEVVFKGSKVDFVYLSFLARFHLVSWFKAKFLNCLISLNDLVVNPASSQGWGSTASSTKSSMAWIPPPCGFLKLNTDGAILGDGSAGDIGGIIRSHNGDVVISFLFFESIGSCPPSYSS